MGKKLFSESEIIYPQILEGGNDISLTPTGGMMEGTYTDNACV
jgi:hypothetical protein